MPRRKEPDPLGQAVGMRIRQLRKESGLTLEKLAWDSGLGSKGYLSDIEHGLVLPSLTKLEIIASHLGVNLFDLLVFPDDGERSLLAELSRSMPKPQLRKLLKAARD